MTSLKLSNFLEQLYSESLVKNLREDYQDRRLTASSPLFCDVPWHWHLNSINISLSIRKRKSPWLWTIFHNIFRVHLIEASFVNSCIVPSKKIVHNSPLFNLILTPLNQKADLSISPHCVWKQNMNCKHYSHSAV